jgi:hypothetical protein
VAGPVTQPLEEKPMMTQMEKLVVQKVAIRMAEMFISRTDPTLIRLAAEKLEKARELKNQAWHMEKEAVNQLFEAKSQ